ncbi:hypothetical protein LFZ31_24385 [Salmonella enterica subsp. enterica serovar Newport str. S09097]|nr:hypothetical protein LFZ31_24385 [Salmonella enterica subsp. enterica serovar Newport str. S09097]
MANRGGSGDLEVLSACNRMNLISYAQISSRPGRRYCAGYRQHRVQHDGVKKRTGGVFAANDLEKK